jgi:hypothetical protein
MARIQYQYRLNESIKEEAMQIAGVNLTKEWSNFNYNNETLTPFIKTINNPGGLIDYQKVDADSYEVMFKSVPKIVDLPIYTKQALFLMSRKELCDICKEYGIVTVNRVNEFLIKEIIERQSKNYESVEAKEEIIIPESTNKEEVIEEIKPKSKSLFDILKKNKGINYGTGIS